MLPITKGVIPVIEGFPFLPFSSVDYDKEYKNFIILYVVWEIKNFMRKMAMRMS